METLDTLARHLGPRGEVVLRRRRGAGTDVEELIVNGVFAMDSTDTSTERKLAELALTGSPRTLPGAAARAAGVKGVVPLPRLPVGYWSAGSASAIPPPSYWPPDIEHLDVVELEDCLIAWAYAGLSPTLGAVARDSRVSLHAGDVAAVLAGRRADLTGPWDAILLDVDNGPDFLIHETNAGLYTPPTLAAAYARLADGGTLAIWCQGPAPDLLAALRRLSPSAQPHPLTRVRAGRTLAYVIYTVASTGAIATAAAQECGP